MANLFASRRCTIVTFAFALCAMQARSQQADMTPKPDRFLGLMTAAKAHAFAHGAKVPPVLSPVDATLLGATPAVNVAALHEAGFRVIPWTTNDPAKIHALTALKVDGIISDRPDILQMVLKEERTAAAGDSAKLAYLDKFVVSAHRGGRGLRPENTLPSFEDGLDHLATELETDTGVSTDHVSLIWHDQFYNPLSCRRADGQPYTMENRVYLRDISSTDAQKTFICDKLHQGPAYGAAQFPDQTNDLALSPVAVAFATHEHLMSPYVPTHAEQLFRFVAFYADFYSHGAGKSHPDAAARAANARTVRFNLETKILPELTPEQAKAAGEPEGNHTVDPQTFVTTLCGAIKSNHMERRAEVQSFDFRTLQLVEEQFPEIPTYYLTGSPASLASPLVPAALRQP
ncbi:glycerophosphodiester phosphodiesterase family protein [Granulicella paludicola]|uniref:glycerophosphodiester phosphodiesterase family protein n=1 Tax=Granulicella paludicola TaxID=474951 RepID=UPI0021E05B90|nr:glycerophosphodiester phosphodiesterase family protein [Granulicella paludicola]